MKRLLFLAPLILLTGCASALPQVPTMTPTALAALANAKSCAEFEAVTKSLAERIIKGSDSSNSGEFKTTMAEMPARLDTAALKGSGTVKDRIGSLIGRLPDSVHMLYIDAKDYFADVKGVVRACEAEGITITAYTWG